MKTIWKFEIERTDRQVITMPEGAEILTLQMQQGTPCLWALVDRELRHRVDRIFETFGTGWDVRIDMGVERKYIGTYQLEEGQFVFHVFERIN